MLESDLPILGPVGSLCYNESKVRDFDKFSDLVSVESISRSAQQGIGAIFNERSMQLGLSTGVAADLEMGWNLETKSPRDNCSNELGSARPRVLIASPPCPFFLTLQHHVDGSSIPLESEETSVITSRSHLIFAVCECVEQKQRGVHFIFEHPPNASSWNEQCTQKPVAQPCVFRIEGPDLELRENLQHD